MPKGFNGNSTDDSDPSVSYDGLGNAYYVYLSGYSNSSGIFINKSTNGGASWLSNSIEVISENALEPSNIDKPYVYIYKSSVPSQNKIFIVYNYNDGNNIQIRLMTGDISSLQFSGPFIVASVSNTANNYLQGPVPIFHSTSSSLYVAYSERLSNQYNIKVARSTNGGISFLQPCTVAGNTNHIGWYDTNLKNYYMGEGTGFGETYFRVNNFPSITSIGNHIYVAFAEKADGIDRITLAKSTNFGASFSNTNINVYGDNEFFPWITSTPDGKLGVIYQSMFDINGTEIKTFLSIIKNEQVIDEAIELLDVFDYGDCFTQYSGVTFIGDYNNIVADNNNIYSVFTSNNVTGSATAIKMGIIPNKVNLLLKAFSTTTPVTSEINFNQVPYAIPIQGLNLYNVYTFQTNNYFVSGIVSGNKFRHWDGLGSPVFDNPLDYSFPYSLQSNLIPINIKYYPTQPLTVTSYLEGGTGSEYNLTWVNSSKPAFPWQYGNLYNAFKNQDPTFDRYTIEAPELNNVLGTNWYFQYWNDGTTNSIKSNVSIEGPTSFTANYKGIETTNSSTAYTNTSQSKFLKTIIGNIEYLHNVYESMGDVWYERSTDGGTTWVIMNGGKPVNPYPDYGEAKSPSIACSNDGNDLVYITYQTTVSGEFGGPFVMLTQYKNGIFNWHQMVYNLEGYSFSPDYQQVVAAVNNRALIVFNPPSPSNPEFIAKEYSINGLPNFTINTEYTRTLPYINALSSFPSITIGNGSYHLAYQQGETTIKYLRWGVNSDPISGIFSTPSTGSGFSHNTGPSISFANLNPIISWKGLQYNGQQRQAVLRRGTLSGSTIIWSDFLKVGSAVNYIHNNSVVNATSDEKTVMAWGQDGSVTNWVRRTYPVNGGTQYSSPANLSHPGINSQLTNGTDYNNMKANIFRSSAPLYYFTLSTTNFSLNQDETAIRGGINKIMVDDTLITYGRSGVADFNGVEFVFNIGDILVGDSIIQFIDKPDTIVYASSNELNEFTRTNNFTLTPETEFYFTNIYYVVQKSNPDTSLIVSDAVNFKAELVNAITNQVVGTFDNITYNKNNLEKYASVDYEVDCSGITSGEYYLRLVTSVNGNAYFALANIISDNTTLAKKNFNKVNFTGSEIPATYALAQNFPNPFNPSTTIRYQLPQDGLVTLKIYDILGSEVATIVNEEKAAGKYEVTFNASSLASGVYIYKIQSGSFINSKKMILLK